MTTPGAGNPGDVIVAIAREELGFALVGVTPARRSERGRELRAWTESGRHGEMGWLAETVPQRIDPDAVLGGARSIIMVADLYSARAWGRGSDSDGAASCDVAPEDGGSVAKDAPIDGPRHRGLIARYARGRDYHVVIKRRLHALCDRLVELYPGERFRAFCDTAPVLEREHAARAGIGWIGKHTLVINPALGSYLLLGGVLTTLDVPAPAGQRAIEDHCGSCTRCIDACPTEAITPYRVDATRCISYLTIEHRTRIEPSLHGKMGGWVLGCDVCQEVCPHNGATRREDSAGAEVREEYRPVRTSFDLLEVLGWSEEDRRRAFAQSAMKRVKLAPFKRNAAISLANAVDRGGDVGGEECGTDGWGQERAAACAALAKLANDESEDPLVRQTASSCLTRLERAAGGGSGLRDG